ncbi:MAG: alpha/beta fold hydrolase, partial [Chloroflexi bacterium]|nr:alpha/beta fold hydrolase [Chloroflexota bacterium]
MKVVRFLGNLILAIVLVVLILLILLTAGGLAIARVWEQQGLDYGVSEEGSWLWVDQEPIYRYEWGAENEPTIVLVHGLDVQGSTVWAANAPDLVRRGNHVLAVDLRGFGHSTREGNAEQYSIEQQALLLAKVLNDMGVERALVVAHGWGARVALRLAEEQPQFVGRLALIAPYEDLDYLRIWRAASRWPYTGRAATWLMLSGGPIGRAMQRRMLYTSEYLPEGYWADAARPSHIVGTVEALLSIAAIWEAEERSLTSYR